MAAKISMTPVVCDLYLYAGDNETVQVRLWADAAKTVPLSTTGLTFSAMFRKSRTGSDTWAIGVVLTAGTPPYLTLTFDDAVTAVLPAKCVWDLQVVDSLGNPTTWITGDVFVQKDVTR